MAGGSSISKKAVLQLNLHPPLPMAEADAVHIYYKVLLKYYLTNNL
jgi:hypothetical protein